MLSIKTCKTKLAGMHFWLLTAGLPWAGGLSSVRPVRLLQPCAPWSHEQKMILKLLLFSDELVPHPVTRCDLKTGFKGHESNLSRWNWFLPPTTWARKTNSCSCVHRDHWWELCWRSVTCGCSRGIYRKKIDIPADLFFTCWGCVALILELWV